MPKAVTPSPGRSGLKTPCLASTSLASTMACAMTPPYIRKTPNDVSGMGALRLAEMPSAIALRVSSGSTMPSSPGRPGGGPPPANPVAPGPDGAADDDGELRHLRAGDGRYELRPVLRDSTG